MLKISSMSKAGGSIAIGDWDYLFKDKSWNDKVSSIKVAYDGTIEAEELQNLQIQLNTVLSNLVMTKSNLNDIWLSVDFQARDVAWLQILNAEVNRLVGINAA